MNYKKLLCFSLLISGSTWALDLQNKFRNSDKSLFETISDYQTIDPGRVLLSTGYSLQSRPLIDPSSKNVLVDGLSEVDFSMITGITKRWELGITAPMTKTSVLDSSPVQSFSGFSDVYFESKFRLLDSLAVVPTYIYQTGEGLATSGSNSGGYGVKIVGSFFESSFLPIYYSIGRYYLSGTQAFGIDQTERTQISIGTLKNLTKEISLGMEYFNDIAKKKHSPKELLVHATVETTLFSVRAGIGSGFLNSNRQNETRFFTSLIFDLDFRKNKVKKEDLTIPVDREEIQFAAVDQMPNGKYLNRYPNAVEETQNIPSKEEVKKQMQEFLKKGSLGKAKSDKGLDNYTVLPFYSTKELRIDEVKPTPVSTSDLSVEEQNLIISKYERLQNAYKNLDYNISIFNDKNKETVIKELNWSLRVVNVRKDTMKQLDNQFKSKNTSDFQSKLESHLVKTDNENKAISILQEEKDILNSIIKNYKSVAVAKAEINTAPPAAEPVVPEVKPLPEKRESASSTTKVKESEADRTARLTKSQQAQWNASKSKTYAEIQREKKGLKKQAPKMIITPPKTQMQVTDSSPKNIPEPVVVIKEDEPVVAAPAPVVQAVPETPVAIIKEEVVVLSPVVASPTPVIEEPVSVTTEVAPVNNTTQSSTVIVSESIDTVSITPSEAEIVVVAPSDKLDVPSLNEMVKLEAGSDGKTLDEKVQELMKKINSGNPENSTNYDKFYDQYKKTVDDSKIVTVPVDATAVEPKKKQLEVLIYQDPEKEQKEIEQAMAKEIQNRETGVNSIELQDFKVNSIESRFEEYKRKKREQEAIENVPSPQIETNNEEGLLESGEIQFSTGPSY